MADLANRGPSAKKMPTNTSCRMSVPCAWWRWWWRWWWREGGKVGH